jgi:hypothetical protein
MIPSDQNNARHHNTTVASATAATTVRIDQTIQALST